MGLRRRQRLLRLDRRRRRRDFRLRFRVIRQIIGAHRVFRRAQEFRIGQDHRVRGKAQDAAILVAGDVGIAEAAEKTVHQAQREIDRAAPNNGGRAAVMRVVPVISIPAVQFKKQLLFAP